MFKSETRVVRNGRLVAFEGEEMTDEEAAKRGLLNPAEEPKQRRKPRAKTQEA